MPTSPASPSRRRWASWSRSSRSWGGNVPLEDSIAIYERGEALKKRCEALLRDAEARVQKITLAADGSPTGTTPLDPG